MITRHGDGRRGGRPPLPREERLSVNLITRVNVATAGAFRAQQRRLDLSESELLRALIVKGLQDLSEGWKP